MGLAALLKPEYVYQPGQLIRRLRAPSRTDARPRLVRIPGGAAMLVSPADDIGTAVLHLGVFDLVVTEALFRLCDPGDAAVDVGANIGYMTGVLGALVGASGVVHSFEPHPSLFKELEANVATFRARASADFHLHAIALSDDEQVLTFEPFDAKATNRGTSRVTSPGPGTNSDALRVQARRLDQVLANSSSIGLMKVDVEGHELAVLAGATSLLAAHRVRDIVFEEHRPYPTPVTDLLERSGYAVFRLGRKFRRPVLLRPDSDESRSRWEATSFLATADPVRATERFSKAGWNCLRRNSR